MNTLEQELEDLNINERRQKSAIKKVGNGRKSVIF